MSDVRSKNPYELLGNDPELDPNREPEPPVKVVDKNPARRGKRTEGEPRASAVPAARSNRGPQPSGNEQAFRDRRAGTQQNRNKPTGDAPQERAAGGHKNRDVRGNMIRDDRQSKDDRVVSGKQVEQGWGAGSGESHWNDERAGEAIAQREEKEGEGEDADKEAEAEEKTQSYAEYLAEQAEAKNEELGIKEARRPNEGAKGDKKWAAAKELKRDEEEAEYIKGSKEDKARREKQRKEKNLLDVDMRYVEPPRRGGGGEGFRGRGRGGSAGGRGRGDGFRGGRGNGEFRGGRGGAPRGGAPRGGNAPRSHGPTVDETNFPSLGGK